MRKSGKYVSKTSHYCYRCRWHSKDDNLMSAIRYNGKNVKDPPRGDSPGHKFPNPKSKPEPEISNSYFGYDFEKSEFISISELTELPEIY